VLAKRLRLERTGPRATVLHRIPVAIGAYGLAVSPDGSRLFVAHFPQGDAISVVDTTGAT
jgi:DNA-binding beta-propeller fold protein YncE